MHALLLAILLFDLKTADDKLLHGDYPGAIQGIHKALKTPEGQLRPRSPRAADDRRPRGRDGDGARRWPAIKAIACHVRQRQGPPRRDRPRPTSKYTRRAGDPRAGRRRQPQGVPGARPAGARLPGKLGPRRARRQGLRNDFYDDHDAGALDENDGEVQLYLKSDGRARPRRLPRRRRTRAARRARPTPPNLLEANLVWGELFLEKYNAADADVSFKDVLKGRPERAARARR